MTPSPNSLSAPPLASASQGTSAPSSLKANQAFKLSCTWVPLNPSASLLRWVRRSLHPKDVLGPAPAFYRSSSSTNSSMTALAVSTTVMTSLASAATLASLKKSRVTATVASGTSTTDAKAPVLSVARPARMDEAVAPTAIGPRWSQRSYGDFDSQGIYCTAVPVTLMLPPPL
ncbi:hypothetical protein PHYBOEH_010783 [Phytophthora boehmeriae]|uniref:Uncharacterized protein n=1 Tax=Phytophthora boehmeriae TaxID=109152 RepID=A0A8T1X2E6_9STRA|nr:hypothetical protein PHYBOEH_010783 [Phytophthora boehmeriae]